MMVVIIFLPQTRLLNGNTTVPVVNVATSIRIQSNGTSWLIINKYKEQKKERVVLALFFFFIVLIL
jgi:hypothetical protein